jgi:hypothetical protein
MLSCPVFSTLFYFLYLNEEVSNARCQAVLKEREGKSGSEGSLNHATRTIVHLAMRGQPLFLEMH